MDKNTPIHARFGACFHGECHYICPTCNKSFESYNANQKVIIIDARIAVNYYHYKICGCGGIGRLGGFRFPCQTAYGFESRHPHHLDL